MTEIQTGSTLTLIEKLQEAIASSQRLTKPMRDRRHIMLEEYANGFFKHDINLSRKPLNLVFRAMSVMVPLLAANDPKCMIRANITQYKAIAETLRLAINHKIRQIGLGSTIRKSVVNSMVYMGIVKCGLADGGPEISDAFGRLYDSGQFFCDNVDPDDYVFDPVARCREEMDWEGNRYRLPLEYIEDSGLYKNTELLKPDYAQYGEKRKAADKIAKETMHDFEIQEIRPYVTLYDIWVPGENCIYTLPCAGQGIKPLRETQWQGPAEGPYETLCFHTFPESIIPVPPIHSWIDLHHYINTMARKMARQAEREKTILAFDGTAEQDASAVVQSEDGEAIRVEDVDRLKEVSFGGVNEKAYPYVQWLHQQWSSQAGNMDLIGGLQSQAETLGQEQMLMANATITVEDMIWQVHNFTKTILRRMAWYLWEDPTVDMTVTKRIPGVMDLDVQFSPESRKGSFMDYQIDVEPYSGQRINPSIRMQKIMQLVSGVVLPTAPLAAGQGVVLDVAKLVKSVARDMDLTDAEVDDWYKSMSQPPAAQMGPYQPTGNMGGQAASNPQGQSDDRNGASPASRQANQNQYATSTRAGKPSPPNKPSQEGVV